MVLKGGDKGFGIPLNAPLYPQSSIINYSRVRVVMALANIDPKSVEPLLPEGVDLALEVTAFWVGDYGISTVGIYREALVAIPVKTEGIELAYYIPYIYVTNDAALAAGRELAGAPKKLADIRLLVNDYGLAIGTLERGGELMRAEVALSSRLGLEQLDAFKALMPRTDNTVTFPLLSVRVLPPLPDGTPGIAQLIHWYAKFTFTPRESPQIWAGETRIKLDGTPFDPLSDIKVTQVITGFYIEGDMELGIVRRVKEWKLTWS
ncbi:MAG: acetoacetate decarboxylase family protein [Vulcanisaeta sp.]|jgi:acetoacetate decarboxylase|uniref:acetoacetate decarboxylase family protein n=1 Tax=Vulcanisaeta sp. TaxID=2020871 RepID=UPI003D0B9278